MVQLGVSKGASSLPCEKQLKGCVHCREKMRGKQQGFQRPSPGGFTSLKSWHLVNTQAFSDALPGFSGRPGSSECSDPITEIQADADGFMNALTHHLGSRTSNSTIWKSPKMWKKLATVQMSSQYALAK
jgi:hypothetical protein